MTSKLKRKGGHGKRSFTNAQIAEIIEMTVAGGYTNRQLGDRYNIAPTAVSYYVRKLYYGLHKGQTREIIRASKINYPDQ